jgi:pyrimidine operon attenuation protein/uracil phosphoribosyltransferase
MLLAKLSVKRKIYDWAHAASCTNSHTRIQWLITEANSRTASPVLLGINTKGNQATLG